MNPCLFSSKFSLKLKKANDEISYNQARKNENKNWIIFLSLVAFIISLLNLWQQKGFVDQRVQEKEFPYPQITILSISCVIFNGILTIAVILIKKLSIRHYLYYLQYFSIGSIFFCIHFSFSVYGLDPENRRNFHGVEALVKILNHMIFLEYIDSLILTSLNLAWAVPIYLYFKNWNMGGFMYPYIFFSYSFVCISYFIVYSRKRSFVYHQENTRKMQWFRSILENMKSGFIHLKDNKIIMINKTMTNILTQIKQIDEVIFEKNKSCQSHPAMEEPIEKKFESDKFTNKILNILLNDLNNYFIESGRNNFNEYINNYSTVNKNGNSNLNDKNSEHIIDMNSNLKDPFEQENSVSFLEEFRKKNNFNEKEFILAGIKSFEVKNEIEKDFITLEVYCRYQLDEETKKDEFEIIFNDVTKTRQIEEKKSEIKYKSIFLSKVAHEFKNPLICIIELVKQLTENFKSINDDKMKHTFQENLNQISSFSNYLMILIRDFDYFSQTNVLMKKISLEKEECDVKEILNFCDDIAINLLKRNGKHETVSFNLDVNKNVPDKIISDEFRIKQVLINLISNSIKFTNKGKIILSAQTKESSLEFRVSDTGVGIDEKNKKNLFSPYNSCTLSKSVNPHGTGLGMSIISDLTQALGNIIKYTSELNKGSDFFFSIPIDNESLATASNTPSGPDRNELLNKHVDRNPSKLRPTLDLKKYNNQLMINNQTSLNKNKSNSEENLLEKPDSILSKNYLNSNSSIFGYNEEIEEKYLQSKKEPNTVDAMIFAEPKFMDNVISKNSLIRKQPKSHHSVKDIINPKDKKQEFNIKPEKNNISNNSLDYFSQSKQLSNNIPIMKSKISDKFLFARSNIKQKETLYKSNERISDKDAIIVSNVSSQSSKKYESISDYTTIYLNSLNLDENCFNIILVDDEKLTRLSNKRLISDFANKKNVNITFIEAEDGLECLYIVYICFRKGIKISCVISDQSMLNLNGCITATILKKLTNSEIYDELPFYILTAYEDESTINNLKLAPITNLFSKPIKKEHIDQILSEIK